MSKIHVDLIKGLKENEKEQIQRQLESSKELVQRLRKIITSKIESSYLEEENDLKVDPLELAASIGERRGLRQMLKYLPE